MSGALAGSPPPTAPAAAPAPPPPPPPPPTGARTDRGVVRVDSVRVGRWTVIGLVKVLKDVEAPAVAIRGTAVVGGGGRTARTQVDGLLEVVGGWEATDRLEIEGSVRVGGGVRIGAGDLRGTVRVGGPLEASGALAIRGHATAPSLAAASVTIDGSIEVAGLLKAAVVTAGFDGPSRIEAIEGVRVALRLRDPSPVDRFFRRRIAVRVGRIEASSVELEQVDVGFVRAPEIRLGRGAHVTAYEGTIVERHPTSRVGPESRSTPPFGLRR